MKDKASDSKLSEIQKALNDADQKIWALTKENIRLKQTLDAVDAAVYVADMKNYELLYQNKYCKQRWGDKEGQKCYAVLQEGRTEPCDFCTNRLLIDENGLPKEPYVWEFQNTVTNQWFQCRDQAMIWPDGKLVRVEIASDISEQKRTKQALDKVGLKAAKRKRQFLSLFEQAPISIHIFDKTGLTVNVNKAWEELWQAKASEIIGKYNVLKDTYAEKAGWLKYLRKVFDGEIINLPDLEYDPAQSGNIGRKRVLRSIAFPVKDNKSEIEQVVIIHQDITEQNEYEKKLKKQNEEYLALNEEYLSTNEKLRIAKEKAEENEERYRVLSNASFEAIFISDKGICIEQNKTAEKMFGYTKEEAIGMFATDIFADESKQIVKQNILAGYLKSYDVIALRKDGTKFNAEIQGYNFNYQGKNLRITAIRDITERKKVEKELIEAKQKAEESDLLKSEFINNMSHEIRTPMNGILGFAKFLEAPDLPPTKRLQYLKIIQNSGNQLMRIIDDILEISQLETKQVKTLEEEICLNDLLLEQFSIFEIKAKEKEIPLYLKRELSDEDSYIYTDSAKLNKILSNLLENAFKFTNLGYIEMGCSLKDDKLEIFVKDTGIGIAPKMQKRIFERFSQEEKEISGKVGGLGLGLSIAKENAELLGGEILLESQKGKGSIFKIILPYKSVNKQDNSNISNSEVLQNNQTYTILIVEDEEINYLYLETLLQNLPFRFNILHAKNGIEAVDICADKHSDIDLVLMDLKMPIMNGFEATKLIKRTQPNLTVIAQSAYTGVEDKQKAFHVGCDDFISKPITDNSLVNIIGKYLKLK